MSVLDELRNEILALRAPGSETQTACRCSCSNDAAARAATVALKHRAHFSAPDGSTFELAPGEYYVSVLPDGSFLLSSNAEKRYWNVAAKRAWHEFNLTSTLALNVPEEHAQNVMVLLPGGLSLLAAGTHEVSAGSQEPRLPTTTLILGAIQEWLTWPPLRPGLNLPFNHRVLPGSYHAHRFGDIQPDPSPGLFQTQSPLPDWISATVLSCAGACGSLTPGAPAPRGAGAAAPGYVTSITPVTVSAIPAIQTGNVVQLLVKSQVQSVGKTPILAAIFQDVYQKVAVASGPVTFGRVIVATGIDASLDPVVWVEDAEKAYTSSQGTGAQVHFELRLNGITCVTTDCKFNANSPGVASLTCS